MRLRLVLLACLSIAACTCEPLGVDKLRFACSSDDDCESPQKCIANECRPATALTDAGAGGGTATGGGDGTGGGSATGGGTASGGGDASTGGGTAATGGGTAATGGGTAATGGGTAATGGGTAATGGGTAATGGGTAATGGGTAATGGGTATGGGAGTRDGGTCAMPTALQFGPGGASVSGITSGTTTIAGSCGGTLSPELVFSFTQTTTGPFLATVAPAHDAGTLRPVLYLRSACSTQNDVSCQLAGAALQPLSLSVDSLDAGTYFLVVDGFGGGMGSAGPFTLSAFRGTPPGDACNSPRFVFMGGATRAIVAGDTRGMNDDFTPTCGAVGSPDIVYQFVAPRTGTLTVEAFATFDAALTATGGSPCDGGAELACSDVDVGGDEGDERISFAVVSGTSYFIWMNGYDPSDEGPYQLVFELP